MKFANHQIKIGFAIALCFTTTQAWAHREHAAHSHGSGSLAIAFDDSKGKIEFKAAAESILGFEHRAQSKKDQKTLAEAVHHFESDIGTMIIFDEALGCQIQKENIGQVAEAGEKEISQHSDWAANYTVTCKRSPVGSQVKVDFSSLPHLHDLDITVLAGSIQKSAEFKGSPLVLDLK